MYAKGQIFILFGDGHGHLKEATLTIGKERNLRSRVDYHRYHRKTTGVKV